MSKPIHIIAATLTLLLSLFSTTLQAQSQGLETRPIRIASLNEPGKPAAPGDLLLTTRTFTNWSLHCEILLSKSKRICTAELSAIDSVGRPIFSWTFALASDNTPVIVLKVPADVSQSYGVLMMIGSETKFFTPSRADCGPVECVLIAALDETLRGLIGGQKSITFSFKRGQEIFRVDAPMQGLSDALEAARRDPIGLIAAQQMSRSELPVSNAAERSIAKERRPINRQ